ncbi:MAG TPA: helix-turn-helix domain-containing protein [Bacteroidetes bacterium]|nr:helix-turn-helix domain-containing protein [Bacteroidota bacterium]
MKKYHPIQLNGNIEYQEVQPCDVLKNKIACFWQINSRRSNFDYLVIPDGCVDIIINCSNKEEIYLSPTLIKPDSFALQKNETWFGIRFYPAIAPCLFNIHISELKHNTIDLKDINKKWGNLLTEQLYKADNFIERTKQANLFFLKKQLFDIKNPDYRLAEMINNIYESNGNIRVEKKGSINLTPRHIRRLFHQYIGIPPKKFSRIVRSQNFLRELKMDNNTNSLYDTYFDQAHMIREIKEMTGFTPTQLVRIFE